MLETLIDTYGDGAVLAMAGALVGVIFGAAAQHSRFCLRSASVEVAERAAWPAPVDLAHRVFRRGAVGAGGDCAWLLDVSEARPLAATGSLSGAIIGGLMFGAGMILARGCASRLLVLSATGNLRALITGLVLTIVAQSALRGVLSPAREALARLWLVPGGEARDILAHLGAVAGVAAALAALVLIAGVALALMRHVRPSHAFAAMGVGLAIGLGWLATYMVAQTSFEIIQISSVTFTGPSTDTLMGLVNSTALPLGFGVGLVPGVFVGSAAMALATPRMADRTLRPRHADGALFVGAALMGFGSMLAGGCAVGAGMSGGAIFALTAWVAVTAMWVAAMATHLLMARPARRAALG